MRRAIRIVLILLVGVVAAFALSQAWRYRLVILWTGTTEEIRAAALAQARSDIEAGDPGVYLAGTVGVWPIGIPEQSLPLIEGLPQTLLPSGCIESLADESAKYAEVYNGEVLKYLSTRRSDTPGDRSDGDTPNTALQSTRGARS